MNARNGTFDSCTLTSGSELWLFLLSVDVTHSCVQSISGYLGGCVCVRLCKPKPESNSKVLRGKSVDIRAGITNCLCLDILSMYMNAVLEDLCGANGRRDDRLE